MQKLTPGRLQRWVSAAILLGVLVLLLAELGLALFINEDLVERTVNEQLSEDAQGASYRFIAGDVDFIPFLHSIVFKRVALIPALNDSSLMVDSLLEQAYINVSIERGRIAGLRMLPLIVSRSVSTRKAHVEGIDVRIHRPAAPQEEVSSTPDSSATIHTRILNSGASLAIGTISLEDVQVTDTQYGAGFYRTNRIKNGSITIDRFDLDPDRTADSTTTLFSRDIQVQADEISRAASNGLYNLSITGLSASTRDSLVHIDSLAVMPLFSDARFATIIRYQKDRIRHQSSGIGIDGLAFREMIDRKGLFARSIVIDSVFLDIFKDKRIPADPEKPVPLLPHEALKRLPLPLDIQGIQVAHGSIQYSEIVADGEYPGIVRFDALELQGSSMCHDPSGLRCLPEAILHASARFMGEGALDVTFKYPLSGHSFDMRYGGTLGAMPATPVNSILTNLTGMHIEDGTIEGLLFDINVQGGEASGTLQLAYKDLSMEFVNKVDRRKTLVDRIKTFIVYDLKIHPDNEATEDNPLREGEVDYSRDGDPFFRFVWRSLRNGILDTIVR